MLENLIGMAEREARGLVESEGLSFKVVVRDGEPVGEALDSYETVNVAVLNGKVASIVPVGMEHGEQPQE